MEEKEIGSVQVAITGTTRFDHSATDASSLVFSWTTTPLRTPSGFLVSVIGSALVRPSSYSIQLLNTQIVDDQIRLEALG